VSAALLTSSPLDESKTRAGIAVSTKQLEYQDDFLMYFEGSFVKIWL
jgi:hypothetical protein